MKDGYVVPTHHSCGTMTQAYGVFEFFDSPLWVHDVGQIFFFKIPSPFDFSHNEGYELPVAVMPPLGFCEGWLKPFFLAELTTSILPINPLIRD